MHTLNMKQEVAYRLTFLMEAPKARGPDEAHGWALAVASDEIATEHWDKVQWEPMIRVNEIKSYVGGRMLEMPRAGMEWLECEVIIYAQDLRNG